MKALAFTAALVLAGASAQAAERIYTPEGWYQVEEDVEGGSGEEPMALIIVEAEPAALEAQAQAPRRTPPAQPPAVEPQPPPPPEPPADTLAEELSRFRQLDCERVRGLYLKRVLELHGFDVGLLAPEALAGLTYQRPQHSPGGSCYSGVGCLPTPALAPLYGEPPIPPGALTFDLELQGLFGDLLECQRQSRGAAPPAPPPAPPSPAPQAQPSKSM